MRQLIAFVLAVTLVTVALPALAHPANHPKECDNRSDRNHCTESYAAHDKCDGVRDHMSAKDEDNDNIVRKALNPGDGAESVKGYVHASKEHTATQTSGGTAAMMPGLVWIESNGFEGLQRTDWKCTSMDHEDPDAFEVHADQVLI